LVYSPRTFIENRGKLNDILKNDDGLRNIITRPDYQSTGNPVDASNIESRELRKR
jgi:hypothetical protein